MEPFLLRGGAGGVEEKNRGGVVSSCRLAFMLLAVWFVFKQKNAGRKGLLQFIDIFDIGSLL